MTTWRHHLFSYIELFVETKVILDSKASQPTGKSVVLVRLENPWQLMPIGQQGSVGLWKNDTDLLESKVRLFGHVRPINMDESDAKGIYFVKKKLQCNGLLPFGCWWGLQPPYCALVMGGLFFALPLLYTSRHAQKRGKFQVIFDASTQSHQHKLVLKSSYRLGVWSNHQVWSIKNEPVRQHL